MTARCHWWTRALVSKGWGWRAWEPIPEVQEWLLHLGALMATRQVRGRGGRQAFLQENGSRVVPFADCSLLQLLYPSWGGALSVGSGSAEE